MSTYKKGKQNTNQPPSQNRDISWPSKHILPNVMVARKTMGQFVTVFRLLAGSEYHSHFVSSCQVKENIQKWSNMFEINNHKRLPVVSDFTDQSNQPVSMSCPTNAGCRFWIISLYVVSFQASNYSSLFHLSYHAVVSPSLLVVSISQYHYWYLLVAPCQETQTLLRRVIYI